MLTVRQLNALKSRDKAYKVTDTDGLFVNVSVTGVLSWRYNYKIGGKQKTKTYGQYPVLTLAEARDVHAAFKKSLALGYQEKKMPTFAEFKRTWYLHKIPKLKNVKHRQQIPSRVDRYCVALDAYRMNQITRPLLVQVVKEAAATGFLETAQRVGMHLKQLFDYAVDEGVLESHPAANLGRVIPAAKNTNMKCVKRSEAPALLQAIDGYEYPIPRIGLLFMAHTFVRHGEMRFMRWDEIVDDDFWLVPSDRLKSVKARDVKRAGADDEAVHVVPLTRHTKALLDEISVFTGDSEFVFESPTVPGQPISENTLLHALKSFGYHNRMTVHGFRSLASTILNEQGFNADAIERQLAHKDKDAIRGVYNRAEYLDERVNFMAWYGDYLAGLVG